MEPSGQFTGIDLQECALIPTGLTWGDVITAGCSEPVRHLVSAMNNQALITLLDGLGLFTAPTFPVETLSSTRPGSLSDAITYITGQNIDPGKGASLMVSPLQMALAASSLSNAGERPSPRLLVAVDTPLSGWVMLPVTELPQPALQPLAANNTAQALASGDMPIWQVDSEVYEVTDHSSETNPGYAWYLGGTLPEWKGAPLAIAVLLEENNPQKAQDIGRSMFQNAIFP
jgi:hypothetical protein